VCCSHMCCSVLQSYVCSTCSVSSHVLQCVTVVRVAVAVCCSVLQRVAVICVAACCSHMCVPRAVYRVMCCSMLQSYIRVAVCCSHMCCSVLQSYVLQRVAVICVLQRVASMASYGLVFIAVIEETLKHVTVSMHMIYSHVIVGHVTLK